MGALRHFLADRRWLATLVVALALWIRLLVPAGFMPVFTGGAIHVEPCSGHGVEAMAAMPAMTSGDHGHGRHGHDAPDRDDQPCGFAGHAPASMAAADPILLVLAIAFVIATMFRRPAERPRPRRGFLRPQPTGPPVRA